MSYPDPPPPPPFKKPRNYLEHPLKSEHTPLMKPRMSKPNRSGNRGTSSIFYKTRMCPKFERGNCGNGEHCNYAHGSEDLRQPPADWREYIDGKNRGSPSSYDDQRIIHRTKPCKWFVKGEACPYGEKCKFAHEYPSRSKTVRTVLLSRESCAVGIRNVGPIMEHTSDTEQTEQNKHFNASSSAFQDNLKRGYWKSTLCRTWEVKGHCYFGESCEFAHGKSELGWPGSHVEEEVKVNVSPMAKETLQVPANDEPPAIHNATQEVEEKKYWRANGKISDIYGDWLDDRTPPEDLPSTMDG